jgi:hypothetical protein
MNNFNLTEWALEHRAVVLFLIIVISIAGVGNARATTPRERVVIADRDPELRRAIVDTLRPWQIDVLPDDAVPTGIEEARTRARPAGRRSSDRPRRVGLGRRVRHLSIARRVTCVRRHHAGAAADPDRAWRCSRAVAQPSALNPAFKSIAVVRCRLLRLGMV